MMKKSKALFKIISNSLGLNRPSQRPYRPWLAQSLIMDKTLKRFDEIIVSPFSITLKNGSQNQDLLTQFAPFTDEERETLCAVLIFVLPRNYREETHFDPDLPLALQVRIHYIKTAA